MSMVGVWSPRETRGFMFGWHRVSIHGHNSKLELEYRVTLTGGIGFTYMYRVPHELVPTFFFSHKVRSLRDKNGSSSDNFRSLKRGDSNVLLTLEGILNGKVPNIISKQRSLGSLISNMFGSGPKPGQRTWDCH